MGIEFIILFSCQKPSRNAIAQGFSNWIVFYRNISISQEIVYREWPMPWCSSSSIVKVLHSISRTRKKQIPISLFLVCYDQTVHTQNYRELAYHFPGGLELLIYFELLQKTLWVGCNYSFWRQRLSEPSLSVGLSSLNGLYHEHKVQERRSEGDGGLEE